MVEITAERQGKDRLYRVLLFAFGLAFAARLVERGRVPLRGVNPEARMP